MSFAAALDWSTQVSPLYGSTDVLKGDSYFEPLPQ